MNDTPTPTADPFAAARAAMDEMFLRLFDRLFPCPYFWLGIDAEWPELVFI